MGLFRCSHVVRMDDMQEIKFEPTKYLSSWEFKYGVVVEYKGHCRECRAFVYLEETVENRALYTILKKQQEQPRSDEGKE